jgi:hypothetical protein
MKMKPRVVLCWKLQYFLVLLFLVQAGCQQIGNPKSSSLMMKLKSSGNEPLFRGGYFCFLRMLLDLLWMILYRICDICTSNCLLMLTVYDVNGRVLISNYDVN